MDRTPTYREAEGGFLFVRESESREGEDTCRDGSAQGCRMGCRMRCMLHAALAYSVCSECRHLRVICIVFSLSTLDHAIPFLSAGALRAITEKQSLFGFVNYQTSNFGQFDEQECSSKILY